MGKVQGPLMWVLILAAALLQFYKSTNVSEWVERIKTLKFLKQFTAIVFQPEERSLSVEATGKSPQPGLYQSREFTFPESNSKRKKQLPNQPSIVPAMTPRVRDIPLQARIEKLAKQKRKERVS